MIDVRGRPLGELAGQSLRAYESLLPRSTEVTKPINQSVINFPLQTVCVYIYVCVLLIASPRLRVVGAIDPRQC